jgi:hypothetical protein
MSEYTQIDSEIACLRTQSVPLSAAERELIGIDNTVEFDSASLWLLKDIAQTALGEYVSAETQWLESYQEAWHISRRDWNDPACAYVATHRAALLLNRIENRQQEYREQLSDVKIRPGC